MGLKATRRRKRGSGTALPGWARMAGMSQNVPYATPKLDGNRVALRGRVLPEQHARAHAKADEAGLSLSEYLGALIDRDCGVPNKLDNHDQEELPIPRAS